MNEHVPASELKLILNAHKHVKNVQFNAGGYVFTYETGKTSTFTESQYREHIESAKHIQKHYSHLCKKSFPAIVNLYPVMAIQAARRSSHVGGGYRLYVLAKALDRLGLGNVSRDELRDYAASLGVSPRQWQRWMTEARNFGLLKDWQRKTGEWMLALPNPGAAAYSMGCENVGNRKASMSAADLIGYGWKARIWAAYEATHNGRPVSRERMQKIVNVPVSTQRYRDVQAGVTRQQNHAKLKARADALPMLREYGQHKGLYIRRDGFIGSRKPDSRFTDLATRGGKGRTRKANATLHRMQRNYGLSLVRQAFSNNVVPEVDANHSVYIRQFNYTPRQRKATERKIAKLDIFPPTVYEYSHAAKSGASVWMEC